MYMLKILTVRSSSNCHVSVLLPNKRVHSCQSWDLNTGLFGPCVQTNSSETNIRENGTVCDFLSSSPFRASSLYCALVIDASLSQQWQPSSDLKIRFYDKCRGQNWHTFSSTCYSYPKMRALEPISFISKFRQINFDLL